MESTRVRIDQVGIVVPAHNEVRGLPRCLHALETAAAAVEAATLAVLVLDSCTDDSAAVAAAVLAESSLPAVCITSNVAAVGGARREGVGCLLGRLDPPDPSRLWIATTDADSVVPPDWLQGHLRHARAGAEIVAGTVQVDDWTDWPRELQDRYRSEYAARVVGDGHGHIHGANLGIRADTYLAVGGFSDVTGDEDVQLIRRGQAKGVAVTWALDIPVCTSARHVGRAPNGFAGYLRELAGQVRGDVDAARPGACDGQVAHS
jgi:hypothetical protein